MAQSKNELLQQLLTARSEYLELLRADVLGPGSEFGLPDVEHEVISGSPIERYSTGILYPQGNKINLENDEATRKNAEDGTSKHEDENENKEEDSLASERVKEPKDLQDFSDFKHSDDPEDAASEEVNMSAQYMPSSMGMMFTAEGKVDKIKGKAKFATYRPVKLAKECVVHYQPARDGFAVPELFKSKVEYDAKESVMKLKLPLKKQEAYELLKQVTMEDEGEKRYFEQAIYRLVQMEDNGFVREPHEYEFVVEFGKEDYYETGEGVIDKTNAKVAALRMNVGENKWSVTLMLVNGKEDAPRVKDSIFQPELELDTAKNGFRLVDTSAENIDTEALDDEELTLEMLYRKRKNYGSGLGVSVDWQVNEKGEGRLWTEYIPMAEVPGMDFDLGKNGVIEASDLSMKYLSDLDATPKEEKMAKLRGLIELYSKWIEGLEQTAAGIEWQYSEVAQRNIEQCIEARDRMLKGIKILLEDENAYRAFELANRAMFMQRVHIRTRARLVEEQDCLPDNAVVAQAIREMDYYSETDEKCNWRPFQIAFILMDIDSIANDYSEDRKKIDLIWFPTGGGKTEAYLGLSAFAIFYRRLRHLDVSSGTAVIMRYTLRLLTAQQFERASTLICACEYIRRDGQAYKSKYPKCELGKEEITIGLWIGQEHVPNTNETAKEYVDNLRKAGAYGLKAAKEKYSKFQVLYCPWCGTKMTKEEGPNNTAVGEWGYRMHNGHFRLSCPNMECDFAQELPIQVVDEELYKKPPALLFGTVDKFAMMTWEERIGAFFGANSDNRAPELIVQDELHLISGALGTIIGLYEMAIDALCSQKGILAKVVASTATIRRAAEQCSNLYNRDVVQFPASGLDADDSFFAREKKIDYAAGDFGRMYVGLIPSGKTRAMMEARVMAVMLQRVAMMEAPDEVKDKYWTFTAYYNSLRDLGRAASLVSDNVKRYMRGIAERAFADQRWIYQADELTSRVLTTKLNETLSKLEKNTYKTLPEGKEKIYPISVLLATNMISVGIDVARLNIMMLVGQPKLTSEYIQASSRVGREYPGIVISQYDTTKSRDRSHYEHFKSYHESFYKYVEPTSVTPFSRAARERALHAVLVALFRQQKTGIAGEKDAAGFDREVYGDLVEAIKQCFLDRIREINNRHAGGAKNDTDEILDEMNEFFDYWDERARICREAEPAEVLRYGRKTMMKTASPDDNYLLKTFDSSDKIVAKRTLTSMRNVDTSVTGRVIKWEKKI